MKKVLIIHGFTSTGEGSWYPWMKRELESRGYEVFTPSLPNPWEPVLEEWLTALAPYVARLDDDDIIVGHSLGGCTALHSVLHCKKKIRRLILVAPAIGKRTKREWKKIGEGWDKTKQTSFRRFRDFWSRKIAFKRVSKFAEVTMIFSDDETSVPVCFPKDFPREWKWKLLHGYCHICDPVVPELLEEILR